MKQVRQLTLDGEVAEIVSLIETQIDAYLGEFPRFIEPKAENTFGFWVQTIADVQLLSLELDGLRNRIGLMLSIDASNLKEIQN